MSYLIIPTTDLFIPFPFNHYRSMYSLVLQKCLLQRHVARCDSSGLVSLTFTASFDCAMIVSSNLYHLGLCKDITVRGLHNDHIA